jgi:FG-GAP repeat
VYEYVVVDDKRLEWQSTLVSNTTQQQRDDANNSTIALMGSFGTAVAYDGDYLIVGDAYAGGSDYQSSFGRIHVYKRSSIDGTFEEIQTIESPDPQPGEMFGATLTYRNDTLVVGDFAKTTANGGAGSGCVYIYQQTNPVLGTFELTQTLYAADGGASHEGFGASVALSDTILVVGLNDREGRTIASLNGGAFVYRRYVIDGATTWKFESLLLAHDQAIMKGQFGGGVAVYGETIVVGSQEMHDDRAGKVYVFRKNNISAQWEDVMELAPSDPSEGHHFGRMVAIYNSTVVVGAFMDSQLQDAGGSAYIFHLNEM